MENGANSAKFAFIEPKYLTNGSIDDIIANEGKDMI